MSTNLTTLTTTTTSTLTSTVTLAEAEGGEVRKLWPAILYTSLLMLVGGLGNTVVCYVYGLRWQRTVTKTFILTLAALDLLNCLVCVPTEVAMLVRIVSFQAPGWCKVSRFLTYTLNGSSSLILVSIAFDRWYKICRPLRAFFTDRRAKATCGGAVVLAASLSWPALLLYGDLTLPVAGTPRTGVTCLVSDHYIDTWWPLVFYTVYFSCYLTLVVVLTVLYSLIAVRLVRLKRQQKERLAAKYAGLRPSRDLHDHGPLSHHDHAPLSLHDGLLLSHENNEHAEDVEGTGGVRIQILPEEGVERVKGVHDQQGGGGPGLVQGFPGLQRLQDDNERRRSVTFRLPRLSTGSGGESAAAMPAAGQKLANGLQGLAPNTDIMDQKPKVEKEKEEEEDKKVEKEEEDEEKQKEEEEEKQKEEEEEDVDDAKFGESEKDPLMAGLTQPGVCGGEAGLTHRLLRDARGQALTVSSDSLQAPQGSQCDTDEFEQGIHFVSHAEDMAWLENPMAGCQLVRVVAEDRHDDTPEHSQDRHGDTPEHSQDVTLDDFGSNSSLLGTSRKTRVHQTRSESFAATGPGPNPQRSHGEDITIRGNLHKTNSDSNLLVPGRQNHDGASSVRRSFLLPPGAGYPGGHTPTSRLPTPTGTQSPNGQRSAHPPPPLLSSQVLLERLRKKMAYRPAKITRMLFAISTVFVVSFLPFFCVVMTRAVQGRAFLAGLSDTSVLLVSIFIRSSLLSNAANPIIYGLCNKQFRTECRHLITRCRGGSRRDVTLRVIEATDDALGSNS